MVILQADSNHGLAAHLAAINCRRFSRDCMSVVQYFGLVSFSWSLVFFIRKEYISCSAVSWIAGMLAANGCNPAPANTRKNVTLPKIFF